MGLLFHAVSCWLPLWPYMRQLLASCHGFSQGFSSTLLPATIILVTLSSVKHQSKYNAFTFSSMWPFFLYPSNQFYQAKSFTMVLIKHFTKFIRTTSSNRDQQYSLVLVRTSSSLKRSYNLRLLCMVSFIKIGPAILCDCSIWQTASWASFYFFYAIRWTWLTE